MYFTHAEKDLIDQLVNGMSPEMAFAIRSKLGEPNGDPEDQALLDEIYEMRDQRYKAEEDALWKD
ncbi:MAG TPA: hypothetical protein VM053_08185 [Gemmatimonadaceae bacterium]|nr:hypothetical protein [Gemmatimonadaceae bacterium]